MGSQYDSVGAFVIAGGGATVRLTFDQAALLVPNGLPRSAREHPQWWRDPTTHPHCRTWIEAGYAVAFSRNTESVTFTRKPGLAGSAVPVAQPIAR